MQLVDTEEVIEAYESRGSLDESPGFLVFDEGKQKIRDGEKLNYREFGVVILL